MQTATGNLAFCETFDRASTVFNRSGQLDGLVWGVSRALTKGAIGDQWPWATSTLNVCGSMQRVNPPNDVQVCNGQLRQSTNDNFQDGAGGGPMAMAMYPKQQFDFSGRVGTVAFDVSNDTEGTHAAWPEFWMTDQPVPTPFNHFGSWLTVPANGFGIRFGGKIDPGQGGTNCPAENTYRFTIDSASIIRDWIIEDNTPGGGSICGEAGNRVCVQTGMTVEPKGCVRQSTGPNGGLNHIELKISQNQIDVYATDAGTTSPLKLIGTVTRANLTLTRGFVWLEDVHYNAEKAEGQRPIQADHTLAWDNLAFDGPLIERERSFDVLDATTPMNVGAGGRRLGYAARTNQPAIVNTIPIPAADIMAAKSGALLFTFYHQTAPRTITYKVNNGPVRNAAWPFPSTQGFTARTISLNVPISDLVAGQPNRIEISADQPMEVSNIGISLQGAGGFVPPR